MNFFGSASLGATTLVSRFTSSIQCLISCTPPSPQPVNPEAAANSATHPTHESLISCLPFSCRLRLCVARPLLQYRDSGKSWQLRPARAYCPCPPPDSNYSASQCEADALCRW